MRATTVTVGPLATASANNGSTAGVLDTPRRVLFTQAASESGKTFTLVGTDANGSTQTEVLTAAASATTVHSALDFSTVTAASISSAASGAITIGTNGVASSRWVRLDEWANPTATIQVTVSGTVNYTVQQTMQDPNSPTNPVLPYLVNWTDAPDPNVVGSTGTFGSSFTNSPLWVRVLLNSETGTGSLSAVIAQSGVVSR
jgi:hypothetical protein